MAWRGKAGKFSETYRSKTGVSFEWKIPNFLSMPSVAAGDYYCSPSIKFSDTIWYLFIYPKGKMPTPKWISLALVRSNIGEPVFFSLGVKMAGGTEEEVTRQQIFPEHQMSFVSTQFLHSDELLSRRFELVPFDSLTVSCSLWGSALSPMKDISILLEHFKDLLLSGEDHDFLITVKDKQFRAHKCVLRARSPVFAAMFRTKMTESADDSVAIDDCDPEAFGEFLLYVYTGKVDISSASHALELYYAADKYDFPRLKVMCVEFLKKSLTTVTISYVINFSALHDERELLQEALLYLATHLEEVMLTVEWQRFVLANPIQGNEMCIKALQCLKKG